ncbi:putative 3-hydroxyisobutyryl- hydrolase protein [Erysiphe necator]|uniref:3-hydroxyisobutyryl-CoA hydrolase n=1 Tax=Uncinula necator TaxID=52586 RepID=A0A0B1PDZ4_UNCNE|nr:putative 3-hydroxyisobutyryl- hydrolase protein [Erysiphe necator]
MFPRTPQVVKTLHRKHQCLTEISKKLLSTSPKPKDKTPYSRKEARNQNFKKESEYQYQKNLEASTKKDLLRNQDRKSSGTFESSQMPLRSKFMDPSFQSKKSRVLAGNYSKHEELNSSSKPEIIKELPDDDKEDVLFNTLFGARFIELNRPSKFNALNSSMIRKIIPRLQEWAKSDMVNVIIIKGCGPKAFCAGGDVVELVKLNRTGKEGQKESADYFALEYKLDHLIATYSKPYVAFMDGYTMGGGVGLSMHAPIRIATERTVFAMPETKIGLFPDIGASFFLPRLTGSIGTYLGLTGSKIEGANVFYSGIATHYLHSSSLHSLEMRLAELRFKDYDSLEERLGLLNSTIKEFDTGLPHDQEILFTDKRLESINRCFDKGSITSILAALEAEKEVDKPWAEEALKTLQAHSPTSLCVTLRLMQLGKKWSIAESFRREYMLAARFMEKSDFNEGVDALLIRKDLSPKWDPPVIADYETENEIVEPYFKTEGIKPIKLLNEIDFQEYPHNNYGFRSRVDVKK